jgi:hypothetical protein
MARKVKSLNVELPINITVDAQQGTYSIEYGNIEPIKLPNGTLLKFRFPSKSVGLLS